MRHLSLKAKIIGMVIIFIVISSIITNRFFINRFTTDTKSHHVNEALLITTLAEVTMYHIAELQGDDVFKNEELIREV